MAAITAAVVGGAAAIGGGLISSGGARDAAETQAEAAGDATALQHQQYLQTRADLAPARQTGNYAFQQMAHLLGLPQYDPSDTTFDSGAQQGQQQPQYSFGSFNEGGGTFNPGTGIGGGIYQGAGFAGLPGGTQPAEEQSGIGRLETDPNDPYRGFRESPGYQFSLDQAQRGANAAASAGGFLGSGRAAKASAQYAQGLASQEYNNYFNQLAAVAGTGQAATSQTANAAISFGQQAGDNAIRAGDARASGLVGSSNAINGAVSGVAGAVGTYLGST